MTSAYTADGKRRSSMTHARRVHTCTLCGQLSRGNGGRASHRHKHVREAGLDLDDFPSLSKAYIEAIDILRAKGKYPAKTPKTVEVCYVCKVEIVRGKHVMHQRWMGKGPQAKRRIYCSAKCHSEDRG